jgi:Co/Zn/Cd efflux system component
MSIASISFWSYWVFSSPSPLSTIFQHVFADTLRSIAVLVAACISQLVEAVTPEEADAAAAVVVSALILLSLIPLFNGLVISSRELRLLRAEEKGDDLLLST